MTIFGTILILGIGLFLIFGIKTSVSPWKHAEGLSLKIARGLGVLGVVLGIFLLFN
ncbi:hypothetical protein [Saccharibacillus sp. O23]|uniref:hypothetical protein n=1 Tax=Saccharibacillus sp. O23 TaxID=2009338 RepID=UPI0015C5A888|nr:hypothetical protein [Saccharibacillus sp. O23]